jgi:hypothetical protein
VPVTFERFRTLALGLEGAVESSHMAHPDFRVAGRVFATLGYPDADHGMVKLDPEQQDALCSDDPAFSPVKGGWGLGGATLVSLRAAKVEAVRRALGLAWELARQKRAVRARTSGKGRKA